MLACDAIPFFNASQFYYVNNVDIVFLRTYHLKENMKASKKGSS